MDCCENVTKMSKILQFFEDTKIRYACKYDQKNRVQGSYRRDSSRDIQLWRRTFWKLPEVQGDYSGDRLSRAVCTTVSEFLKGVQGGYSGDISKNHDFFEFFPLIRDLQGDLAGDKIRVYMRDNFAQNCNAKLSQFFQNCDNFDSERIRTHNLI